MTKYEAFDIAMKEYARTHYPDACRAFTQGYDVGYKDALAQQVQEPVAWMIYTKDGQSVYVTDNPTDIKEGQRALSLYATPQRPWVELTDKEIWETISRIGTSDSDVNPYAKLLDARAIEAKLKQKNGYAKEKNT